MHLGRGRSPADVWGVVPELKFDVPKQGDRAGRNKNGMEVSGFWPRSTTQFRTGNRRFRDPNDPNRAPIPPKRKGARSPTFFEWVGKSTGPIGPKKLTHRNPYTLLLALKKSGSYFHYPPTHPLPHSTSRTRVQTAADTRRTVASSGAWPEEGHATSSDPGNI